MFSFQNPKSARGNASIYVYLTVSIVLVLATSENLNIHHLGSSGSDVAQRKGESGPAHHHAIRVESQRRSLGS
jgi:hypothetical protein